MPISSVGSSGSYEHQLEIILSQELKVEDLQAKLINNGGSYAAMIKNEEQIKVKFAELMKTKYPELSGLSADQIVDMINKVPQILTLDSQISEALNSLPYAEFNSIGELEVAIFTVASDIGNLNVGLQEAKTILDGLFGPWDAARTEWDNAETAFLDAQTAAGIARANYANDPSPANAAAVSAAISALGAANATRIEKRLAFEALDPAYQFALTNYNNIKTDLEDQTKIYNDLVELHEIVLGLDEQRSALVEGNVVYTIYSSFSDIEKELIDHFTN